MVDVDPGTAVVKVRRFVAVDDCGTRINPMIVEGQIHGGLTDGVGMALMETIAFDEDGNCLGGSLMDYLIPTARRGARLGDRLHRDARPRTTRSARRGSASPRPSARRRRSSTPICDALGVGVRHVDMPCTPSRVWEAMPGRQATA